MKPLKLRCLVLAICTALLAGLMPFSPLSLFCQTTSGGTIVGTVIDQQGGVIPNATITVTDASTKVERTTLTNGAGQYVFVNVPPGTYDVTASFPNFSTDEVHALTVSVGSQSTASFKMVIGAQTTTVEVTASNADLQTMNATTGTTVDPSMVDALPTIGREVASFTTMQPGVSPGGNDAGTTTDQASFTLDGGNNSGDMDGTQATYTESYATSTTGGFGGAAPQGTMPMTQDSIEEFKVATTGQTADFNNSSGSQTQAVTKRGHDKWTGTVYEYYLDNNFNANSWQNNYPSSYTAKPEYHFSRLGAAAGGPIAPRFLGGKTYLFANFEAFRYPYASTYERTVPSYEYLQLGQLSFAGNIAGCTYNGTGANNSTCSPAQLKAADPRGLGLDSTLAHMYNTEMPVAPAGDSGSTGFNGVVYPGIFDNTCGGLSTSICDGKNIIGYKANVSTPQSSNFLATRLDHDFGDKWHLMASYRFYRLENLTNNQVDIGGVLPGDKIGVPTAVTPRPQEPWYFVVGLTTSISSTLTNDFHYSYLRNYWNYQAANAPAQVAGAGGAVEPLGEYSTTVLSPYNVNSQSIRVRTWDGKDNFFSDNVTKLKGNHLLQIGGQFQHNYNYFSRSDNGASINFTPTYLVGDTSGGGNIAYTGLNSVGAGTSNNARILDTYYGLVTDTQVANSYANAGATLNLNPSLTPAVGRASIPYYNIYATDNWHVSSSLTLNLGLSYAIEMPPTERNGNQVMFTDTSGKAIYIQQWLAARKAAAQAGQVYNPEIGFTLIRNVLGGRKYPYDPFYGAVSPRVSLIWSPSFQNDGLGKIFGNHATAIRVGYGRIYGRVNGDAQVLPLLAGPGLIVATQCKYAQSSTTGTGGCNQTNFTDKTAYRFGPDGLSPILGSAGVPATLPQPYHPGFDGPGVSLTPGVDPSMRPNDVDTFNFSIQRQVSRRMLVEVGYIGRLIHHEYMQLNPNVVPYMLSEGGQSFESAYIAVEQAFGCTVSASMCAKSATPTASITPQPFFETALAGSYCSGYNSCTAAVVAKQASNFRAQKVFSLWQALDNNVNGASGAGFVFPRSMMGTADSNATYGSAGQMVAGVSADAPVGFSNYHGGYVSFKTSAFRGLTLQENLTYSKALGTGANNQSSSGTVAEDSFNLREQYGRQDFDQRLIFNTFIVYETPWFRGQNGFLGRLAGGWTLSPIVTAGSGTPLTCTTNNSGQNFGGEDGSNFTDGETCIFNTPYNGGSQTHRGVAGGVDPNYSSISIGTSTKGPGPAAVNMFTNPVSVYDSVRPPILGLDMNQGRALSGLPYLNLDFSIKKRITILEKYSLEFSGVFQNVMNHLDFANPSLSLQSASSWGVTKTQGNSPRQFQMGLRAYF